MRTSPLAISAGLILLVLPMLAAAEDTKPLVVELKSFKLPEAQADLFGYNEGEEKLFFYTNGTAEAKVKVPSEGRYVIVVKASGDRAQNEGAKFKVVVDGKQLGKETETTDDPKEYRFEASLKPGEHKVAVEFTNDVYKEGEYDRNLYVHGVTLAKAK